MKNDQRCIRWGAALGVLALGLTGCAAAGGSGAGSAAIPASAGVTIQDAWVKSAEPGEMTAGFGTLDNTGAADVTVVAVQSAIAPAIELHETVVNESGNTVMREVEGGFVIPAHDHLHLEPGGNHIMLMDLPSAVLAGDDVALTLEFSDGSALEFTAVVKDYAGANEKYEDGDGGGASAPAGTGHGDHAAGGSHASGGDPATHGDHADHATVSSE